MKHLWASVLTAVMLSAAPLGGAAYAQLSPGTMAALREGAQPHQQGLAGYRIGPLDTLQINVFQVPDLTREVQVDASGVLLLPLIGEMQAAGLTPAELSRNIKAELERSYLHNAQVTVAVKEATSLNVTVDGAVIEPGVYAMRGPTTLLQAVALAKGPDPKMANLRKVAVFRSVDGRRHAATFDLAAIRAGKAEDPLIQGNDIIVVETSGTRSFLRDLMGAVPVLSIFRPW